MIAVSGVSSLIAGLALAALATDARADLRFAHANDAFTDLNPPVDDSGFTTDLSLAFWRPFRGYDIGGALHHRWLTEVGGDRRRDEATLLATAEDQLERGPFSIRLGARLGPVVTGNWGGRALQNGWHSLTKSGPTLDEGLQDRYEGGSDGGVLVGGRASVSLGGTLQSYAVVDGQLAIGTGTSAIDAAIGTRVVYRVRCVELSAHVEGASVRYHVSDDRLAIPGGYRPGFQTAWRAGFHVAWRWVRTEFQYRANEGGSGEPIAVLAWTFKKRGESF